MYALEKIFAETSHTKSYRDQIFYHIFFIYYVVNSAQCAFSCHLTPVPSGGQKSLAMAHKTISPSLTMAAAQTGISAKRFSTESLKYKTRNLSYKCYTT